MCAQYGTLLVRYWILLLTYGQGSNTSMMRILRMRMFTGALYAYTHTLRVGVRVCAPSPNEAPHSNGAQTPKGVYTVHPFEMELH